MEENVSEVATNKFSNAITLRVDGPYFPAEKYRKAYLHFLLILSAIDKETSSDNEQTVDWSVAAITEGSLNLQLKSQPKTDKVEFERCSEIIAVFANGLESIKNGERKPYGFSNEALKSAKALGNFIDPDDFAEIEFISSNWRFAYTEEIVEKLSHEPENKYYFFGSVEGKLISLNIENGAKLGIRSPLQKQVIKCFVDDEDLFIKARDAIGKRVYVYGKIRQVLHGQKLNIKASEIKVLTKEGKVLSSRDILKMLESES